MADMNETEMPVRDLRVHDRVRPTAFFVRWEMILVYLLVLINAVLIFAAPDLYFAPGTVASIIRSGMDLSFMVLGMTLVLMIGEIDVSVASIMIVSCTVMGLLSERGIPDWLTVVAGLLAGGLCGAFNGVLVAKLRLPSVIVTIATSMLFRGGVQIVLDVNTLKVFPAWFSALSWQDLGGIIPYSLLSFLIVAVVFTVVLHKTKFGRQLYMIGNNATTSAYSGLPVTRVQIIVFTVMGVTAALSGILFAGRLGGISSGMGTGYELNVIAIAVLGGVSTKGGKGNAFGPIIATLIMAFLTKTLDLLWVHANVQQIIIGAILLVAVLIPVISERLFRRNSNRNKNGLEKTDVPKEEDHA